MVFLPYLPLSQNEFESIIRQQNRLLVSGDGHINIFRRYRPAKRGNGVFSFLSKYGRYALPFLKKFILPSAKDFSKNVVTDMIAGNSLKATLKKRGKESLKDVGNRILSGAGRKRRQKPSLKRMKRRKSKIGKGHKNRVKKIVRRKTTKKKKIIKKTSRKKIRKRKLNSSIMNTADCSRSKKKKKCPKDIFSF